VNELALFAGAGGGILGGHLLGWRTICAVEWDAYAASVLVQRQNDGCLPPFPVWDDVQTFDGRPWRGRVDVVSGGFPCQDISAAGKGAGIDGERSGMWGHMARIVGEVRPRFVFVENSPMLVGRGLTRVLGDLTSLGYDARWGIVGAHHVAAPHKRDRIWIVGNSDSNGKPVEPFHDEAPELQENVAESENKRLVRRQRVQGDDASKGKSRRGEQRGSRDNARLQDVADSDGSGSRENLQQSELRTERALQSSRHSGKAEQAEAGQEPQGKETVSNPDGKGSSRGLQDKRFDKEGREVEGFRSIAKCSFRREGGRDLLWWPTESDLGRELPDGMANRVDINGTDTQRGISRVGKNIPNRIGRLTCIGNGQVPQCAALAWKILSGQDYEHIRQDQHPGD